MVTPLTLAAVFLLTASAAFVWVGYLLGALGPVIMGIPLTWLGTGVAYYDA